MGQKLDLTGQKFGKLLAVRDVGKTKFGVYNWLCECECGNTKIVRVMSLTSGNTKSCGCECAIVFKHGFATRGKKDIPEYNAWENMKQRCYDPNKTGYYAYGARGITVCERWKNSFPDFLSDMGKRPSSKHSLDRYPNYKGNYEPGNCRWATKEEQVRNTRRNVWLKYNGEKMIVSDLAFKLKIPPANLRYHLKNKTLNQAIDFFKLKVQIL